MVRRRGPTDHGIGRARHGGQPRTWSTACSERARKPSRIRRPFHPRVHRGDGLPGHGPPGRSGTRADAPGSGPVAPRPTARGPGRGGSARGPWPRGRGAGRRSRRHRGRTPARRRGSSGTRGISGASRPRGSGDDGRGGDGPRARPVILPSTCRTRRAIAGPAHGKGPGGMDSPPGPSSAQPSSPLLSAATPLHSKAIGHGSRGVESRTRGGEAAEVVMGREGYWAEVPLLVPGVGRRAGCVGCLFPIPRPAGTHASVARLLWPWLGAAQGGRDRRG